MQDSVVGIYDMHAGSSFQRIEEIDENSSSAVQWCILQERGDDKRDPGSCFSSSSPEVSARKMGDGAVESSGFCWRVGRFRL